MLYDGTCFKSAPKPDPPKPDPGEGCTSYYMELRCFKPKHPSAFSYNLIFKIHGIAFNDVPHFEFAMREIDNLDLALRNSDTSKLAKITVGSQIPVFEGSEERLLTEVQRSVFPSSCSVVVPSVVTYQFNKLKLYPNFSS